MKLIIQPDDGPGPLLAALRNSKKSVELAIFRFDRSDIESALKELVARGVRVTALVAEDNRGGAGNLRQLESRFLEAGITVARSANDLVRYHEKLILIDRRFLFVLSFNLTYLDIDHSRSFGIKTQNPSLIQEAARLFEADCARRPYTAGSDSFVVSPVNSRKVLRTFLKRAKKQLLIYDQQVSDKEMLRVLQERTKAGVEIRVIGKTGSRSNLNVRKLTQMRLHTRTIIRDARQAFVGSQSLRTAELDSRRELGLIVRDPKVVKRLLASFESDWSTAAGIRDEVKSAREGIVSKKEAEKAAQVLIRELHPLTATVKKAVNKVVMQAGEDVLQDKVVKATMKKVVKNAVKKAVREAASESTDSKLPAEN